MALLEAGVELTLDPVPFEQYVTGFGRSDALFAPLVGRDLDWSTQILHAPPPAWAQRKMKKSRPGTRAVGITIWETDVLHPRWATMVQEVDELWLPNAFNMDAFAGVDLPKRHVPHVVDLTDFDAHPGLAKNPDIPDDAFVFLCVSQWTARKNFEALLAAYCAEFGPHENVCLVLKTFGDSMEDAESKRVMTYVHNVLSGMHIESEDLPSLSLQVNLLTFRQMVGLYRRAQCYVSPHCAEGWGLGMFEAMACSTPVMATAWSGNMEFCREGAFIPLEYQLQFVRGMPWSQYATKTAGVSQRWAQVDEVSMARKMRWAFGHREELAAIGARGRKVVEDYTPARVGATMRALCAR